MLLLITKFTELHPGSVKLALKHKIHYKFQMVVSFDLNNGKVVENTKLISHSSCVSKCSFI